MEPTITKVRFTKIRDVKSPSHAHSHDAGTDFFVPEYSVEFVNAAKAKNENRNIQWTEEGMYLGPHERVLIPSGIKVDIQDKNMFLEFTNKSGVANNKGLIVGSNIVDADYLGELGLSLINTTSTPVLIKYGEKIVQGIMRQYFIPTFDEITTEEFNTLSSDRGSNGFGSGHTSQA